MFKLVESYLKKIGKSELLPAGIILTGGGSSVQTMSDLAKAVLKLPSRHATIAEGPGSQVKLQDGTWAVAYVLTIWGFTQGGDFEPGPQTGMRDIIQALFGRLGKFLP